MQGLKRMRLAAGLSLRELGSRLGVSAQAVHKWETGVAWPSAYLLPQIAEALDCSIAELYAEEPGEAVPDGNEYYTEEERT